MVSVNVKHHVYLLKLVPNNPYGLYGRKVTMNSKEFRAHELFVKVEVAVQDSPSLISLMVCVDVKQL